MPDLDHIDSCARIEPAILLLSDVVAGADFSTPVPTCGDWDLAELARHIGSIHRWVERMVRTLTPVRIPSAEMNLSIPEQPADFPAWLRAGAAPLREALQGQNPDAAMWSWGADKHVRFWSRRMVHETTVHRVDAEFALGRVPVIAPEVAADGIDEFLVNTPHAAYWAPQIADIKGAGETIVLTARDHALSWTITLHPTGYRWCRGSADAATVQAAASVADLYLLLWNRRGLDDPQIAVTGEQPVLGSFLQNVDV